MAKKKGELDPVSERLMAFVEQNGGPSKVAAALGKHPQLFYNVRDGASKPSMDTLKEIKLVYPELNLDWIIMGVEPDQVTTEVSKPVSKGDAEDWKKVALKALQDRDDLTRKLEKATEDGQRLLVRLLEVERPDLFTDQEHSKIESGSQPTDYLVYAPIGFDLSWQQKKYASTAVKGMEAYLSANNVFSLNRASRLSGY